MAGISGFSAYFPAPCVSLADWARWTGNDADKLYAVVGRSFRMCPPDQNVYTMAAEAVLRLIDQYEIDTGRIGFLGLGTESSTDNSAGAIIVKGLVDSALASRGQAPITRRCEVPEVKHACLGGVYALKSAIRFVQTDGARDVAIVVASDIAVYTPGSSGEQTQGAGAVAMLVEADASILAVDLGHGSRAASFRQADFRKPLGLGGSAHEFHYPVFQGKFSTTCYIESLIAAASDFFDFFETNPVELLEQNRAVFLHRPYQRMADTGKAFLYLLALSRSADSRLEALALQAGVEVADIRRELEARPDLAQQLQDGEFADDVYLNCHKVVRVMRGNTSMKHLIENPGAEVMQVTGNLYTASMFAWIAAGLSDIAEAQALQEPSTADYVLAVGYGSGDATEVLPMQLQTGWQAMVTKSDLPGALAGGFVLSQSEYQALQRGEFAAEQKGARGFRLRNGGKPGIHGVEDYRFVE